MLGWLVLTLRSVVRSGRTLPQLLMVMALTTQASSQVLINVDFGAGAQSPKWGLAGTGQQTNDFWNLYSHYHPRFVPGMALVSDGSMAGLKSSEGSETSVSVQVRNAPGVWGNMTGDPMYDSYIFAQNGSNLSVTVNGLIGGRYHFYLYGHAEPDGSAEQNSLFTLRHSTNALGPLSAASSAGWRANLPMQERLQYVVFRDVEVEPGKPVVIEALPGPNGVAVINGLQIISRGSGPPRLTVTPQARAAIYTNLNFREINYIGNVSDSEARFQVSLVVESQATNEISAPLFEGDVAVVAPEMPEGLRITSQAREYRLVASAPGLHSLKFDLVAKITRAEPWNQISFTGPSAAIATVKASPASSGVEMQLLSGTAVLGQKSAARVEGFLGADRVLSMRWQSRATEITRKSLVTVDTAASGAISPTAARFTTRLRYEILQAPLPRLTIALPPGQVLIRLQGEQIRDWQVKGESGHQLLRVEFIKPIEKEYALELISEQPVDLTAGSVEYQPPQPLDIERETGTFTLSASDTTAEIESVTGLKQINAAAGQLVAYRFFGRPVSASVRLKRIEPVIKTYDRLTARLEEARLVVSHALKLTVEKAGVYSVELTPQPGFSVSEVHSEGMEDWKLVENSLRLGFTNRVLGVRNVEVTLEQPLKSFPSEITVLPLRVTGATQETAQVGAASALGIRLKTSGNLSGLREIPITQLPSRADELLAFIAEKPDWKLSLESERLSARVVAEVFNLITIGDGLIGGSATIRYGLINQGVQEFQIRVPAHWKNVEFTGANIRRKENSGTTWTISLQDKAWGGYTLVVTYDHQFDPKAATLDLAGLHADKVERESGSMAITVAGNLKIEPQAAALPLRLIDPGELAETDRALITRPVFLAYRYEGSNYTLSASVKRHEEVPVLDAVADRTQITSVMNEEGEVLTQASFMVKNNDRQFQRFRLPVGAEFWAAYVNNQPVKAERDKEWLLVSLPRGASRDEAFAVDIVYAQKLGSLKPMVFRSLELEAPSTDIPNTYAEWELYTPPTTKLSGFGGNMTVKRGTTYGLREAWQEFVLCYRTLMSEMGVGLFVVGGLVFLVVALTIGALRRGSRGVMMALGLICLCGLVAGIILPNFVKARTTAQKNACINNLRQIAGAKEQWALENKKATSDVYPDTLEAMVGQYVHNSTLVDPVSGERLVYAGAGKRIGDGNAVIAYIPNYVNGRTVLFGDGRIETLDGDNFNRALNGEGLAQQQVIANSFSVDRVALLPQSAVVDQLAVQKKAELVTEKAKRERVDANAASAPSAPNFRLPASGGQLGGGVGAGGFLVGAVNNLDAGNLNQPAPAPGQPAQVAVGTRSIRIDIPKSGKILVFTKVLNLTEESLKVQATLMRLKFFNGSRMLLQFAALIVGLILVWRNLQAGQRKSLPLAVGWALLIGAVTSMFIAWRSLHYVLITALPVLVIVILVLGLRRLIKKKPGSNPEPPAPGNPPPLPETAVGAAMLMALLLGLAVATANAQEKGYNSGVTNAVSLTAATYTGTVNEHVGQFDLSLQVVCVASNQVVPLFGEDVAIQSFSADNPAASLVRQGSQVCLRMAAPGKAMLTFKLAAKLSGDVSKRRLNFQIPPALASKLSLSIDEAEADVEFPTAVSFRRETAPGQTRVEAVLGAGDRVDILWTPRVKRATEVAASMFAQIKSLVLVGAGAVNVRSVIEYHIAQGELRLLKLSLPGNQRLLKVEGEHIRTWELNTNASDPVLTVELVKPATAEYRLTLEMERALESLPSRIQTAVPRPQEVLRSSGMIALCGTEDLSLTLETSKGLQRVDTAEFLRNGGAIAETVSAVFSFLQPGFELSFKAESVQPQIEVLVMNSTRINFESVALTANLEYTVKKSGIFTTKLAIPEGYRVESVSGNEVQQWNERSENRTLEIQLKGRTLGNFILTTRMLQSHKEPPKTLAVAGVAPLEVDKVSGFVSVSTESGISVKAGNFEGLTEIPSASLPASMNAGSGTLAYKFLSTPTGTGPWKLSAMTESMESWVRAEVLNLFTVKDTLIGGRALVRFEIANAPIREFRFKVPSNFTHLEISGPDIRRRDQTGNEWRVELQNKTRGFYLLNVTWEIPRAQGTNMTLPFTGVEVVGVERETGSLVLLTKPPMSITERKVSEQLVKIDANELPAWAGIAATPNANGELPVLVYQYLRPGWSLLADARRFEEAAVLQAIVDNARITTVVADDGQMMTEMNLEIRNNGRQHLEIELPPGAKPWSAFVAGQPLRPSLRNGRLMLPLDRSTDTIVSVSLTYVAAERFPHIKGDFTLASPKLDLPLKNARWTLYLPPDYTYEDFNGSMAHEADSATVIEVFSLSDYLNLESSKRMSKLQVANSSLKNIKDNLARGSNAYNQDWYNFKFNNGELNNSSSELKALEKDVRRAQSSNLIRGQRTYVMDNAMRLNDTQLQQQLTAQAAQERKSSAGRQMQSQSGTGQQSQVDYEAEVAEQQWERLEKAQQVKTAAVQPLRANLPTRGQRHSFTQILQTAVNKPITITFRATNTRESGWIKSAVRWLGAFGVLWLVVAVTINRNKSTPVPR